MVAPKVSIILNNYNYGRFVAAAVESALAQTYSPCEVIAVDDGSTDDSREVLAQYADRVKLIFQKNSGQATAQNLGFSVSTGSFVLFLDSDDVLFPNAIEAAVNAWRENAPKVQFPLEILSAQDKPTGMLRPRAKLSRGDVLAQFLRTGRYITPPTSGNFYSRSFLERILPIPVPEWTHGDAYFDTCAPFFGEIIALDSPLAFYRVHEESFSSVVQGDLVNLRQLEKLIRHAIGEKSLLERLAHERGLEASKGVVVSHWLYLKLALAHSKLTKPSGVKKATLLASSAFAMFISVLKSGELTPLRKLQNIVWAFGVAILPAVPAKRFIRYAFDTSPQSGLLRLLRKA